MFRDVFPFPGRISTLIVLLNAFMHAPVINSYKSLPIWILYGIVADGFAGISDVKIQY